MLSSAINFVRFATISFRISYASRTRLHPVGEPKSFFFGCLLTQNTFFLIEAYIMLARGSLNSYFNGFEIHLLCDRIVPNKKLKKKNYLWLLVVAVGVSASGAGQPHACSSLIISVLRIVWRLRVSIKSWFWRRWATPLLLQVAPSPDRTYFLSSGRGCRMPI